MTNPDHLAALADGIAAWNTWREVHPQRFINLRGAELRGMRLEGANLSWAHLIMANLAEASLSGANLLGADLSRANLQGADLYGADLDGANLREADLRGANLYKARAVGTNFSAAQLSEASLGEAFLQWADLRGADLTGATLGSTNLYGSKVDGADFGHAHISWTNFGNLDLSNAKGLELLYHEAPSTIGIDTLYRSGGNIPERFLSGTGVPVEFIEQIRSLVGSPIPYYSAFISYAHEDAAFADKLFDDLQDNHVRVWYAPEHLKIGQRYRARIDESIRHHDKLLLVLSQHSMASDWVDFEVEAALEKGGEALFPVRIDDAVMDAERAWARHMKRVLHIGDFRQWKEPASYQAAFQRLLRDLRAGEEA